MTKHISPQVRHLHLWDGLISSVSNGKCSILSGTKLDLDLSSVASGLYLFHFDQVATPYKLIKQ